MKVQKDRFTPKANTTKDPADIIAEKQHKNQADSQKHRVSLNIPRDKHDIMKQKSKEKGLTLTAYIMTLINEKIENA